MTTNTTAYRPGARVKVAPKWNVIAARQQGLDLGVEYVVESCRTAGDRGFLVRLEDKRREFGSSWFVPVGEGDSSPTANGGVIPFTLTKDTSREYALKSNSRSLVEDQRRVLDAAAKGEEVDAVSFRKAVTAALSLAATRHGQSMGRREYTKMARHLLYIVDAVIDNALAGLPPVEPGQRSPKIRQQEQEIADLQATVRRLATDKQQAQNAVNFERDRVSDLIREKSALELQVGDLTETLDYAKGLLDTLDKIALGQVFGFQDALAAGIK